MVAFIIYPTENLKIKTHKGIPVTVQSGSSALNRKEPEALYLFVTNHDQDHWMEVNKIFGLFI